MKPIDRAEIKLSKFNELISEWKQCQQTKKELNSLEIHEVDTLMAEAIKLHNYIEFLHSDWIDMVMDRDVQPNLDIDIRIYKMYIQLHEILEKLNSTLELFVSYTFQKTQAFQKCFEESKELIKRISEPKVPLTPLR